MAFTIKKVRPMFTGIITTANRYSSQKTIGSGLLVDPTKSGSINPFQTVISVGPMVTGVEEGNIVRLNFKRYAKAKHVPGAIEDNIQSDDMSVVYEIPVIPINGTDYLFVQNNDIEYVVEDYDGVDEGGLLE